MGTKSFPYLHVVRYVALLFLALTGWAQPARAAADLPLASEVPLAGIGFDDKPLYLPVQKNFQMAMITAGSELGRSCGRMEAFGWRLNQSEQARVDQIFNSTVDRFRGLGYAVEMQSPSSVSSDITMFTADRSDKHFLSMWSAGEIGLVMVLCETGGPGHHAERGAMKAPAAHSKTHADKPVHKNIAQTSAEKFSPVGSWVGSYICNQGFTGGTLTISRLHGENFEGSFHFYPTSRNQQVAEGRYAVYGQYDRASQRILVNPGKWTQRPKNYYNTIMVGSFDVIGNSLSAYFQGITGCTSFEAKLDKNGARERAAAVHHKQVVKSIKHKIKKAAASPVKDEGVARTSKITATTSPTNAPGASKAVAPAAAVSKDKVLPFVVGEPLPDGEPVPAEAPAGR